MFRTPDFLQKAPLFKRLIPSLSKRYAKWFRPRFLIERRHGVNLLLDQCNLVDRVILTRGYWEKEQLDYLLSATARLRQAHGSLLFLDIGSHCGLYSVVMKHHFPDIEAIAFEPEAVNHAQLNANLLINDMLGAVQVHRLALSDHAGEIYLTRPKDNRGVTHVADSVDHDPADDAVTDKVQCQTLDALLSRNNAAIVAKIDVEGHEIPVLRGMRRLLLENRFVLQIESFSNNFPQLQELMSQLGYAHVRTIDRDHYFSNSEAS